MKIPVLPGFDPEAFNKYFKNAGWLMMARVGSLFLKMLVTSVALPNYLGKAGFGVYVFPIAFSAIFVSLAALGLDSFTTRELLRDPKNQNKILGSTLVLRIGGGVFAFLLACVTYLIVVSYTPYQPPAPLAYVAIVVAVSFLQAFNVFDNYFQARAEGKYIMLVQVGANIMSALIKFLLILLHAPLDYFIWALFFDGLLIAISYCIAFKKRGNAIFSLSFDSKIAKRMLIHAWPLAVSGIMVSLYVRIDQIMIDVYLGEASLGIYSTVANLSEACYFIPVALLNALFPAIMNARRDSVERYKKRLQNLYDLMVIISVTIAIGVTILAPYIYQLLYDPAYNEGSPVLAIHIWASVFVFLGVASNQYLIAEGLTKLSMVRTLIGAIFNILINLWAIPRFGLIGAAYSTVLTYFISAFFIILFKETRLQGLALLKAVFMVNMWKALGRFVLRRSYL